MCAHGITKTVILNRPREVSGKTRVQVDSCIAKEIQMLNDNGVRTLGCCCGHGKYEKSILIHETSVDLAKALGYKARYYHEGAYDIG